MPRVKVNATVSAVCTALYLAECVWAYFVVRGSTVVGYRGEVFFAVAMVGVMCMLNFSKFVGRYLAAACGANKLNARKFGDQTWQFVIHVSMTIVELRVLADETWYSDPPTAFAYQAAGKEFPVKPDVQWLYAVQLSIWIITCFSHHFLEARHKDYVLMYAHAACRRVRPPVRQRVCAHARARCSRSRADASLLRDTSQVRAPHRHDRANPALVVLWLSGDRRGRALRTRRVRHHHRPAQDVQLFKTRGEPGPHPIPLHLTRRSPLPHASSSRGEPSTAPDRIDLSVPRARPLVLRAPLASSPSRSCLYSTW